MDDIFLSKRFLLFQLTHTDRAQYQDMNRILTEDQIQTGRNLAGLLEVVWDLIGPFTVSSAYRCPELNTAVGSSDRSQHLKFEAADFVPAGDLNECFRDIWREVKASNLEIGQLIHETDDQRFSQCPSWIHISLGSPWRPQEKCQQVLRMESGKYTMLS